MVLETTTTTPRNCGNHRNLLQGLQETRCSDPENSLLRPRKHVAGALWFSLGHLSTSGNPCCASLSPGTLCADARKYAMETLENCFHPSRQFLAAPPPLEKRYCDTTNKLSRNALRTLPKTCRVPWNTMESPLNTLGRPHWGNSRNTLRVITVGRKEPFFEPSRRFYETPQILCGNFRTDGISGVNSCLVGMHFLQNGICGLRRIYTTVIFLRPFVIYIIRRVLQSCHSFWDNFIWKRTSNLRCKQVLN